MKTATQLALELSFVFRHPEMLTTDPMEQAIAIITEFVKEIETEVIGNDEAQLDPLTANKVIGLPHDVLIVDRAFLRNKVREEQRSKLQQILKDQKEEV